jgi:hypothetical protein
MPKKIQDRRTVMLPTGVYEELSFLQAKTRLVMREQGGDHILSRTSMTNVLKALILYTPPEKLAELLK